MKHAAKKTDHFTFRLEGDEAELLCQNATQEGLSPGLFAREVVRDRLHQKDLSLMRLQMEKLHRDVAEVRRQLEDLFREVRLFRDQFLAALPDDGHARD